MPTGVVKWYDPEEAVGVITPDDAGPEVRAQRCAVHGDRELRAGQRVEFDIWLDATGSWANNIRHADGAAAAPWGG
ncbi:cold shock domain-containing protein [Streptomyces sp. NPDC088341]|uniref:cold-shock protein n=1 Tax=Streptomyces sp. NPDC088341 TaxID=3154870 RepID=UPI00343D5BE1